MDINKKLKQTNASTQ